MKRLHLSKTNKVIGGVCGGFAEYFGIDASILRIIWAVLTLGTQVVPGVIIYIICFAVLPKE